MKNILIGTITLSVLFLNFTSYASKLVNDNCINDGKKPIVLIAADNNQFKDSVLTIVKSSLEELSYCVKIIPYGDLGREIIDNYKAAIIVTTCQFGHISGGASKFLKKAGPANRKKIMVFVTSGSEKWHPKDIGVDCVSSASKLDNAVVAADSIVAKAKLILQR
jgi:hypothetical protein